MVTQGISDTNRQFESAIRRGDAAGASAVYTEQGKILAPDTPMMTGRESAQGYWQAVLDMGVTGIKLETLSLEEFGDTAVEVGTGTLDIKGEDGQTVQAYGKFVLIWKHQSDGSWKWDVDCFNFDAPLG